MKKTDGAVI